MKSKWWIVAALLLMMVAVIVFFVLLELHLLNRELRADVHSIGQATVQVLNLSNTALAKATVAEDRAIAAADQQTASWKRIDTEIAKTVADVHDITVHTDLSLNGTDAHREWGVIPRIGTVADTATITVGELGDAARQLGSIAPDVAKVISQVGVDSHAIFLSANGQLTDPAIHETFMRIADSSLHFDSMAASGDASMLDVKAFVHRETTPVRGTWNVIRGFVRDFGGPIATVAK